LSTEGTVSGWDDAGGYGTITADDGTELFVHCTALVDGSRTTVVGQRVAFEIVPGRLGRWEAAAVTKL
jgi:cold shock protein